ncbi:elongation factor P [Actinobaculum suis]|uniref:elongation factor P n=1 Tax=Actinobaculum suis TaxID=1657 RepID=UPI0008087AAB|nr:elongation factor P [Actinobaculum suis]OCA93835.1 elongation factor P [Actinobaculum suis]OCA94238.1 elongation factor P [Actinobaculum suis]
MTTTNDLKNGMILVLDNQMWQVVEFLHVKPGKGPAFVRTKLRNVMTGKTLDRTLNAGIKVETATIDRRDMQYLYNDGSDYIFMDKDTFDQIPISPEIVGDAKNFLLENDDATIASTDGRVLFVEMPASVELTVTHTEPGVQGNRSSAGTKPATVETGYEVQVPLFINEGDRLKIDTRTGEYISRAND